MRWKKFFVLLVVLFLLATAGWFLVVRMEREKPALAFDDELQFIGKATEWSFTASDRKTGLRQVRVWVRQGPEVKTVLAEDFPSAGWGSSEGVHRHEGSLTFDPKALGLSDGAATVIVAAQDNSLWKFKGNSTFREFPVIVDTIPPRVSLLSTVHNVRKGGTGLVAFRLSEEAETAGVELDGYFFPSYPEETGAEGSRLAYFAFPHDAGKAVRLTLLARDQAGNEARRTFPSRILDKKFPRDTITVSDGFLERKVPEFQAADPSLDADLLKAYLTVNRDWRQRDHDRLREFCSKSASRRLWSGAFLQMRNTKNMSSYAVRRTYVHRGRVVDKQVHLGLDLASTAGAPVPAANGGVVTFAGELGIYGQTVLLDHGQGLFSLYSHLSGLAVDEGQTVERGETVGSSGQTGMAGGDHLHFSMLVSGEFVNPVEWFDDHWITDNIKNKLEAAGSPPGL
jgi:murein DD-endopeptidase MepM/ murein hydrolase activator NlpD